MEKHPRFHTHFTPTYSSWSNQIQRLFAELTRDLLQHSDHRSVQSLEKDLGEWVTAWNENPKPFISTKTAEDILNDLAKYLKRINGGFRDRCNDRPCGSDGRRSRDLTIFSRALYQLSYRAARQPKLPRPIRRALPKKGPSLSERP